MCRSSLAALTACTSFVGRAPADAASDADASQTNDGRVVCEPSHLRGVVANTSQLSLGGTTTSPWEFHVKASTRDSMGGVLIAGGIRSCTSPGHFDAAIVRLTSTFQIDRAFGEDGRVCVRGAGALDSDVMALAIAVDAQRRIVIAGNRVLSGTEPHGFVARVSERGEVDRSFGAAGYVDYHFGRRASDPGFSAVLQSVLIDGARVVVAGSDKDSFVRGRLGLVSRLDENGSIDRTFNGGEPIAETTVSGFYAIAKQGERYVVAGSTVSPVFAKVLRITVDGAIDSSFGEGGAALHRSSAAVNVRALGVDGLGRIYVAGGLSEEYVDSTSSAVLVRFEPEGATDESYGANGVATLSREVWGFAYAFDRNLLVRCDGSALMSVQRSPLGAVAMLDPTGQLATGFGDQGIVRIARPLSNLFGGPVGLWFEPNTDSIRGVIAYSNNQAQTAFELRP